MNAYAAEPWSDFAVATAGASAALAGLVFVAVSLNLQVILGDVHLPGRAAQTLILLATLRNRAAYTQEWPDLELTLTDTYDAVLIRKVFKPREYLPEDAAPAFNPGDTGIRLQLDAGGLHPAGYRLYLFYP